MYSHSTTLALNGSLVGSAVVPDASLIENTLAPQTLILGGVAPLQQLSLRSTHRNQNHYTIASGFSVTVSYDEHTRTGCFTPEEVASAGSDGLMCTPDSGLNPPTQGLRLELAVDKAALSPSHTGDARTFRVGEQIPLIARVSANGTTNLSDTIRIELSVPRGLVPQGMTIQGEEQSLLDTIFSSIAQFLARLGIPFAQTFDNGLDVAGDDQQVTFSYDYDRDLVVGQSFPITLDVVGEVAGTYTISGEAVLTTEVPAMLTRLAEPAALLSGIGGVVAEQQIEVTATPDDMVILIESFPGIRNELVDMQAVANDIGLFVHDGPTWNAMKLQEPDPDAPEPDPDTPPTLRTRIIPWGSTVQVDYQLNLPNGELWVRLTQENDENDAWINLENGKDGVVYIYYDDSRPSVPELSSDALISFTYDRQAAAEYGIAHAYRNSIRYNDDALPSGLELPLYPSWVQANFQRRVTRYFVSDFANNVALAPFAPPYVDSIRYAPFWYGQVYGYGGFTGSAVFNSELIWMGGLPMTEVSVDCSDASINTQWRYCPEKDLPGLIGGSSGPWDTHTLLTEYYSKDNTVPNVGLDRQRGQFIGILDMYDPLSPNFAVSPLCNIVVVFGENPLACNASARESGFPNLDNPDNAARMFALLTDTAFIDNDPNTTSVLSDVTYGGSDRKPGQIYPGDISVITTGDYITVETDNSRNDGHGFFVVGWGSITSCATAMSQTWILGVGGLYSAYADALEAYPQGIVPYVVDFPGGVDRTANNIAGALAVILAQGLPGGMYTDQLQRPLPRPFYCSAYNDPARSATERLTNGTEEDRPNFDASQRLGFWRFYTILPRNDEGLAINRVEIPAGNIYVPLNEWFWNADPNRCFDSVNCGG